MRNALRPLALAAAVIGFATMLTGTQQVTAADTQIAVNDFYFCDQSFQGSVCETTINVGDAITWAVAGGSHTVTQCDATFVTCPPAGGFDSGTLNQGQQFQRTFNSAGTFYYHCTFHPQDMRGTIVVQPAQAGQATPTPTPSVTPSPSPSATAGATATPTRSPTPAAVPATGGEPSNGGAGVPLGLLILAGGIAASAGIFALRKSRVKP